MNEEVECKTHPDAPHGFVRNASHTEDRLVCECEYWEEPKINDRIKELGDLADELADEQIDCIGEYHPDWHSVRDQKFAELIVQECIGQCQREWYDLNNTKPVENETARDIGIRVGQKTGVLKCINQINKHFGVE